MKEQNGESYASSTYAKVLAASESKVGKSAFIIASALGVFPGQTKGGIVDHPSNLHVITFDANALGHLKRFLTETCGASAEALKFNIYNMQDDLRQVSLSQQEYDSTFYNTLLTTIDKVRQKAKGHLKAAIAAARGGK